MNQKEFNRRYALHKKWLAGERDGEKLILKPRTKLSGLNLAGLDLSWVDFKGIDLSHTNLQHTNLDNADLRGANLQYANLYCASLKSTYLTDANLMNATFEQANCHSANFKGANLACARFSEANCIFTNFRNAKLNGAYFNHADLCYATFTGASFEHTDMDYSNLFGAAFDESEQIRGGITLTEPMIGYKKCMENTIVELEIPKGAIVFSINNGKCRTNIAKVVKIEGNKKTAYSMWDKTFKYKVGQTVYPKNTFGCQYNQECGGGIHFFKTREEAEAYE